MDSVHAIFYIYILQHIFINSFLSSAINKYISCARSMIQWMTEKTQQQIVRVNVWDRYMIERKSRKEMERESIKKQCGNKMPANWKESGFCCCGSGMRELRVLKMSQTLSRWQEQTIHIHEKKSHFSSASAHNKLYLMRSALVFFSVVLWMCVNPCLCEFCRYPKFLYQKNDWLLVNLGPSIVLCDCRSFHLSFEK